ncbi:MAG TPA: (Fe-S)-binding protein, partial [Planctomycetaceae bacterium]|nr:(Fe-S)-binding protein [Planctomycetaceae bacterium]
PPAPLVPNVGLFIPCYIDQFYPQVGLATVEVLERLGVGVEFPEEQTCCGQPMANTGCTDVAAPLARRFVEIFKKYDAVVCPSGSCVAMVRQHYHEYFHHDAEYERLRGRTYELCEYLTDVLKVGPPAIRFPYRVGLHQSCHGLRELRLGQCSELVGPAYSKARQLLEGIDGLTLFDLTRPDECCGFGGTFAVSEEAVSCLMGRDRVADHLQAGAEVLTAVDMSCLMHLDGLIRRDRKPLRVMHIAEILAGRAVPEGVQST